MRKNIDIGLHRAKLKDNNKWVYWNTYGVITDENGVESQYGNCISQIRQSIKPETVGEFIGISDKNGKKIFEDDIIHSFYRIYHGNTCRNGYVIEEERERVAFRNGSFVAENDYGEVNIIIPNGDLTHPFGKNGMYKCVVIGNVFDDEISDKVKAIIGKRIPKKPYIFHNNPEQKVILGKCPCCKKVVDPHHNFYNCTKCGQLLKWDTKK